MAANQLKKLTDENDALSLKLCYEDSACIRRICNYLRISRLCGYQTEVIRKDLIGMSLESSVRGESLKESLGISEKEFCRQMVESGRRTGILETFLLGFKEIISVNLGVCGFFLFFSVLAERDSFTLNLSLRFLIMIETAFLLSFLFNNLILPRFSLEGIVKKILLNLIYLALALCAFTLILLSGTGGYKGGPSVTISLIPACAVLAAFWLIVRYCYIREIQKISCSL